MEVHWRREGKKGGKKRKESIGEEVGERRVAGGVYKEVGGGTGRGGT